MKLEEQVVSLELAKELKELGVKQDSLFSWIEYEGKVSHIELTKFAKNRYGGIGYKETALYAAFTVAELGEMLKSHANILPQWNKYNTGAKWFSDIFSQKGYCQINEETEADARAEMAIYLIKAGIIEADEIGK